MSCLPPNACRLRVRYKKDGRLAYLGHLEVMNTIMRCVRRAGLPFEVGNGFAHRMRIQFSQALPVGASSRDEYYDLLLTEPIDAHEALVNLRHATPAPLMPQEAAILPRRVAALEAWANLSCWEVRIESCDATAESMRHALDRLREIGSIDYMRGEKPRHLKLDGLISLCEFEDSAGGVDMQLETRSTDHGSLRPAVLVRALLGVEPLRVCRCSQWHADDDGTLTSPMSQGL